MIKNKIPGYVYEYNSNGYLQQGDVIALEGNFRKLFKKCYPMIEIKSRQKKYVMIVSQTCDLVRTEDRQPKINHINVAIISTFSDFINERIIPSLECFKFNNATVIKKVSYEVVLKKLTGIINNSNLKENFFLPAEKPFNESMIVYLPMSLAFRVEHYDKIDKNSVLSLKSDFRSKIGYLIATIYGRVATDDLTSLGWDEAKIYSYVNNIFGQYNIRSISEDYIYEYIKKEIRSDRENETLEILEEKAREFQRSNSFKAERRIIQQSLNKELFERLKNENVIQSDDIVRQKIKKILDEIIEKSLS